MATIDATVGGANANSYITVAFADTFLLEERLGAEAWDSVENKVNALIMATQQIDRLNFVGDRATETQTLSWPRYNALYPDNRIVTSTDIPVEIKRATAEMAFWLSQSDRTIPPDGDSVSEVRAGPIAVKLNNPAGIGGIIDQMPDVVKGHLNPLMRFGMIGGAFRKVLRA